MKKLITLCLFILLSFGVFAQYPQVYYNAVQIMNDAGYTVANSNSFYGNIQQSEFIYANKTFYSGTDYIIVGISEDLDVKDVDIHLYYLNGVLLGKDDDSDDVAVLYFSPTYDITLQVQCKNYRSTDPYYKSKCWILIGYK
ncbi:MAG: hypothetical protein JXA99_02115 [Candidatus Lokiarchaeota archaeon]|nr:hypothetical protein [Candidatus Lokiarchaeota archaeon]